MSVELTGTPEKIDDFAALLQPFGIVEIARSGIVAMERGRKVPVPRAARAEAEKE
jgi:acetolactate synthase-1/3 small subunit